VAIWNIPYGWTSKNIEEHFSKFGPVLSAKVALSPFIKEETSRKGKKVFVYDETLPSRTGGYGFVCFENEEHANALIENKDYPTT
jgi:RNA recognition motif-containing protein